MSLKHESLYFKSFLSGMGLRGASSALNSLKYHGVREDLKNLSSDYKAVARDFNKATKKYESTSSN